MLRVVCTSSGWGLMFYVGWTLPPVLDRLDVVVVGGLVLAWWVSIVWRASSRRVILHLDVFTINRVNRRRRAGLVQSRAPRLNRRPGSDVPESPEDNQQGDAAADKPADLRQGAAVLELGEVGFGLLRRNVRERGVLGRSVHSHVCAAQVGAEWSKKTSLMLNTTGGDGGLRAVNMGSRRCGGGVMSCSM